MLDSEQYRIYAKLNVHRLRVATAEKLSKEAMLKVPGTWAISYSGGKDSMVLLDILLSSGWHGPLFHFYYAETPTENTAMAREMAESYGLPLHLLAVPGAFDVYQEVGHFFVCPQTPEERVATNRMMAGYKRVINDYAAGHGWAGQFMGLRGAESRQRAMMLWRKGELYQTRDREGWTCCPLAKWEARDVWAYIVERELPYLQRYDQAEDPERERSETTWLAAETLWRHGMAARMRIERPDEFAKLVAKWPEIRKYT